MLYPVTWTIQASTAVDPEIAALTDRVQSLREKLKQEPPGARRREYALELIELGGRRRTRMRELGEKEASLVMALVVLVESWKYAGDLDAHLAGTSLVAHFPGSEDGGTVYCDRVVAAIDPGGPGVNPNLIKTKHSCEGKELESFLTIEAIADAGGVDSSSECVQIAEGAGGSYQVLLTCLKSRRSSQH